MHQEFLDCTKIHMISHTHWDREWYSSFEVYRARLLELIDSLLCILENEPDYESFQLDGQTSMIEDYLELRPEKRESLVRYITEGRLLPGPWYTQPDEFLASGESLIRNLMLGIKIGREFGRFMPIGYLPDSFGHISQMPQILKGFGIEWAFAGRGVKLESCSLKTRSFDWQSPDGSRVLTLSVGYGNGVSSTGLTKNAEEEAELVRNVVEKWGNGERARAIPLFHGSDHIQPRSGLQQLISETNGLFEDLHLVQSTLPAYFSEIAPERNRNVIEGELRDNRTGLLEGTLSTYMDVKIENASTETLLEHIAEPVSVMAWLKNAAYPSALLGQAWKYVLQNHAHDSICSCSVDEVNQDVLQRFRWAQDIGSVVVQNNLRYLANESEVPGSACGVETCLEVFNTLGRKRSDIVKAKIDFAPDIEVSDVRIFDSNGDEVQHQLLWKGQEDVFVTRRYITPRKPKVFRLKAAFIAKNVPAMGSAVYRVIPVTKDGWTELPGMVTSDTEKNRRSIASLPNKMENEYLRVLIQNDGTLTIISKEDGKVFEKQVFFEDGQEIGEVYNHAAPLNDHVKTNLGQPVAISLIENGPVYATYEIQTSIPGICSIKSYITLADTAKRVDIVSDVDNFTSGHRLRAVFPLGELSEYSFADGQFDTKKRLIKRYGIDKIAVEKLADCHPMESFVEVEGENRGMAILTKGLPEYEAHGEDETFLKITLIRSVKWGPYNIPVEGAQMQGKHRFEFSIFPHVKGIKASELYREAMSYKVSMPVVQSQDRAAERTGTTNLFNVETDDLILSAVKQSANGEALIVRLFNTSGSEVEGKLIFKYKKPTHSFIVDLNEENPVEIEHAKEGEIKFPVRGKGIITLKISF
ncbi:MAG: hypothetical protein FIA99_14325 [Ruminiclostridium sp.]|nr:hypothetical protein [Ruminiclostridium sp.]